MRLLTFSYLRYISYEETWDCGNALSLIGHIPDVMCDIPSKLIKKNKKTEEFSNLKEM